MRRVLLVSTYNFDRRPWNGVCFEFLDTISRMEEATIVAPEAAALGLQLNGSLIEVVLPRTHPLRTRLHNLVLMHRRGRFRPTPVEQDHDLCLFMCQFPWELRNLRRVRGWRRRSRFAAAFVLETWSATLGRAARDLAILDEFDHVFVLNAASASTVQRYTRTPVSALATGVDCLTACPSVLPPERVVDILALGRRADDAHPRMLEVARERGLFFQFDLWTGLQAVNWRQIRDANADLIQRSRYFVVWAPGQAYSPLPGVDLATAAEHPLSTRYFEGSAGGAILIGTRCRSPEFDRFFDDPDAVVEIAPDGSDFAEVFASIEADPARQAAIRRNNIVRALRSYDWAYRWEEVLRVAGLEPTAAHRARVAELERRALLAVGPPTPRLVAEA